MSRVINDSDEQKNHKGVQCETESEFRQSRPTKKYSGGEFGFIKEHFVHYLFW